MADAGILGVAVVALLILALASQALRPAILPAAIQTYGGATTRASPGGIRTTPP